MKHSKEEAEDKAVEIILRNSSIEEFELDGGTYLYRVIGPEDFLNMVKEISEVYDGKRFSYNERLRKIFNK